MPRDPRKQQKKLERRKAKQKSKKKSLAARGAMTPAGRLQRAARAPVLHSCTTTVLWEQGLSNVMMSRVLSNGSVAYAMFLLDIYCLGVKDVMFDVVGRSHYDWQVYEKMFGDYDVVDLTPESACRLIEGAVEYARDLGFAPHADYRKAKLIFGDIDAEASDEEFSYGKDGKPLFIGGPYDSMARCLRIINQLTARCGEDGFHYVMPIDPELGAGLTIQGPVGAGNDEDVP